MAENRIRKRLYSENEIGSLIQRATELQRDASESAERGLSLQEIEHIAAEIGIDSAHLRKAAAELEIHPDTDDRFRFWGGPFSVGHERVVEGTLTEEQWERIVLGLRRVTGSRGTVNEIGRIREWERIVKDMDVLMERTQVTVNPRTDQTTISVRKHFRGGAQTVYVLSVLLSGTIAGIFLDGGGLSDLLNATIVAGSGVGGLAVARASIAYWTKRQKAKLKDLTDWLHETIAQPATEATDGQVTSERLEIPEEEESQPVEVFSLGVRA